MQLNPAVHDILDFKYEDFKLLNYRSHACVVNHAAPAARIELRTNSRRFMTPTSRF